jgi:ribosomal protein S18 acetylase RimI-like enzyme
MLKTINIQDISIAEKILKLQKSSYQIEADIIHYNKIPPLIELINSTETFVVYESQQEIIGFLSYQIQQQNVEICRLAIHPNHFKNGIATKLFNFLLTIKNIKQYIVSTAEKNLPAITFYLKNGFVETHKSTVDNLVLVHFVKKI